MVLFKTVEEHDAKIAAIDLTMDRAMGIGQEHANDSGGSSRSTTEVDFEQLAQYKEVVLKSRAELCRGGGGYKMGIGS